MQKQAFPANSGFFIPHFTFSPTSFPNISLITKQLTHRLMLANDTITNLIPPPAMDPPNSPPKPDLHPILARRYFDKLEDQSMRSSSVSDRSAALEAREREITRDRRDNETVAADLLRRERSVVEAGRRLEKREKEIDGRPTREEVEVLEAQLEGARGEGKSAIL